MGKNVQESKLHGEEAGTQFCKVTEFVLNFEFNFSNFQNAGQTVTRNVNP